VSKRRICELDGIPRLLDLLKTCGEERTMLACLYTLLNLSTEPDNQVGFVVSETYAFFTVSEWCVSCVWCEFSEGHWQSCPACVV
jgi:hypothetical protein